MNSNPKALDLDAVRQSQNKVTTAFKCEPHVKISLAENAADIGLTLSHYLEELVTSGEEIVKRIRDEAYEQNMRLIKRNSELTARLTLYETDLLKRFFSEQMGKSVSYIENTGQKTVLIINDLPDVNQFIQNSFKIFPDA